MLFYILYALMGFITGVYFLNSLNVMIFLFAPLPCLIIKRLRSFTLSIAVFCMFFSLGGYLMHKHNQVSPLTNEFVTVTGRVSEIPYLTESAFWCYTLNCSEIDYAGITQKFDNRITVYSENEYKLDDTIIVKGFLKLHSTEKNPGCFNAYTYYKSIDIDYKLKSIEDFVSDKKITINSPYSYAMRIRNYFCNIIDKRFEENNAVILKYILANFRKEIDADYTSSLLNSGVLRCLYSPYFHLILILAVLELIIRQAPNRLRRILICIVCVFYICINPYILTARKLFTITIIYELLKMFTGIFRKTDALWITILLCAIQNPFILYNEGFIMSCVATLFIIVFFDKIFDNISWVNKYKRLTVIAVMFFISIVLLLPVAAFLFDGISVYSIFVSLLLLPIISTIYIISPLMIIEASFGVTGIASLITNSLVTFVRNIPTVIEFLPFSYVELPRPSFVLMISILFLIACIYKRKQQKTFLVLLSVTIGLFMSFTIGEIMRFSESYVIFVNVGQGDCTITDIPYKCTVMVDGGGSAEYNSTYDVGERDIFPYLRYKNIRKIDYVFLSHYHKDHADGIISLMDYVKIKNIFLPDCLIENEYRVMIEEKAKKLKIKLHYITEPETITLSDGLNAEILYFDKNANEENDASVVMRLNYKDFSCLYTGDITKDVEKKILDLNIDVSADILKVAHHSSATSSSSEFLEAVNPKFAVASLAKDNTYGFPSKETVEAFKILNIPFLTTAEQGMIEFKEKSGRLTWQKKTR